MTFFFQFILRTFLLFFSSSFLFFSFIKSLTLNLLFKWEKIFYYNLIIFNILFQVQKFKRKIDRESRLVPNLYCEILSALRKLAIIFPNSEKPYFFTLSALKILIRLNFLDFSKLRNTLRNNSSLRSLSCKLTD